MGQNEKRSHEWSVSKINQSDNLSPLVVLLIVNIKEDMKTQTTGKL